MNNERMNIINKIANLLAKADSTTFEAEAESARKLAAKLMASYEVKKAELEKDEKIVKVDVKSGNSKRMNMKHATLFNIICQYCGVYMLTCGPNYILCGKQNDIEAATYMFDIIWKQAKSMSDYWYKKNKPSMGLKAKHKNDYFYGLIMGVQYNLDKINDQTFKYKQENGMVAVNQNKSDVEKARAEYTKNNKVSTRTNNIRTGGAYNNGFKDSENIKMRQGVNNNKKTYAIA